MPRRVPMAATLLAAGGLVACTVADDPPALSSTSTHLDYPNHGTCRGTCYPETIYVTAMDGAKLELPSYRCVDYEFSHVNASSRVPSVDCNKVAQCLADGLCTADPAILPQYQRLVHGDYPVNATDGYGVKWLRAKSDLNQPKQYFLAPDWFDKQVVSTYTATQPPASLSVAAALGGQHPCPVARERIHGTQTCVAGDPHEACDLRRADPSDLISDTESCNADPQLDSPRQWFHATGSYPSNAPEGQWDYDVDGTGCAFAVAGIVGKIAVAYMGGVSPWTFKTLGTSVLGAGKCIPSVTAPQSIDHFIAGPAFGSLPYTRPEQDEMAVDIVGEVCKRSIGYKWKHTREVLLYTLQDAFSSPDTWERVGGALSIRRFDSGGSIVIEGTEPCEARDPAKPNSVGLDTSTFSPGQFLMPPWRVTDRSTLIGHCDYRGCNCSPQQEPKVYTDTLPPDPCPPVMPPPPPPPPSGPTGPGGPGTGPLP